MFRRRDGKKLPPGPSFISSHLLLLTNSLSELAPLLSNLKFKYGPLISLSLGSHSFIFVNSHSLAHQALIQQGAFFSDRPKVFRMCSITSASYGPTWRLLRRNLVSEFLCDTRVKSYSCARKWALGILIGRLQEQQEAIGITVVDHFYYAIFSLSVFLCFGQKLDELRINELAEVQRRLLLIVGSGRFNVLFGFPRLGKILFIHKRKEFQQLRNDQKQVLVPLIKQRTEAVNSETQSVGEETIVAYVDTLVKLQLPDEECNNGNGGKLTYKKMVSMCGEFLNVSTETTSNALQWIMANLVKHPHIQKKLYDEIVGVVGPPPPPPPPGIEPEILLNEEDLQKMVYLKAVVLEGLRRHPPGNIGLPRRVTKEVEVEGYTIPQGATISFMVAEMGLDPTVWDDPMEFKPERFMVNDETSNGVFDINGSKGIKMMPFGAGRRICPGYDLALLHLEYFVANLIWYFQWNEPDGYHVDLSEKIEFTVEMKNPLQAQISSRAKYTTT